MVIKSSALVLLHEAFQAQADPTCHDKELQVVTLLHIHVTHVLSNKFQFCLMA